MKLRSLKLAALILFFISAVPSFACTSVIISGKRTADGRPVMMKHRDTDYIDNRVQWFRGTIYNFIGLVNSSTEGAEVWTGTNSAGFSIMNTASYNIKDDDLPEEMMDREGDIMFRALGSCATVSDFELLLSELEKPLGVEANFGIIDAQGGASYFEVNNHSWVKYDVNAIPEGYRVVTNFSESGRFEDALGYERYLAASSIMKEIDDSSEGGLLDVSHKNLYWNISRSYRHGMTGIDYLKDYQKLKDDHGFSGVLVDQDFIPRRSTASSVVIEGVAPGQNPSETVMWTILGYPSCSVPFPLMVFDSDIVPAFMKMSEGSMNAAMCDAALKVKERDIFHYTVSNGEKYFDLGNVIRLLDKCYSLESSFEEVWNPLYEGFCDGSVSIEEFKQEYKAVTDRYYYDYLDSMGL